MFTAGFDCMHMQRLLSNYEYTYLDHHNYAHIIARYQAGDLGDLVNVRQ